MNTWTRYSIQLANQRNYLDLLFSVYSTIPNEIREINQRSWDALERAFNNRDNINLIRALLALKLSPIKDAYIAYLRKDPSSIERNPETVNRLAGRLYEMGLDKIFERSSEPKETNRQMGSKFKEWLAKETLGIELMDFHHFRRSTENGILMGSDGELSSFARSYLGYQGDKGLDFVARMHHQYIIGEAKFLTDFGGHQNAQFNDALNLLREPNTTAIKIAILDGVLYIPLREKQCQYVANNPEQYNIMSALVLREFLYQI